jgi:hypothetical protein
MNPDTVDGLSRLFNRLGTRRAALGGLLGAAVLGPSFCSGAAKPELLGKSKPKGKRPRRGKTRGKSNRRVHAQAKTKPGNHCISPTGRDLNLFYSISAQIVAPSRFGFVGCDTVGAGERWVDTHAWAMEHRFVSVPMGFTSAWDSPLEDFLAKFVGVRYVIDPGTTHEQSVFMPTSDQLFIGTDTAGLALVNPGTLGTMHPLPIGEHVFDVYWVFSAMHCDGIGNDPTPGGNCFPAGETKFTRDVAFTVVPGHH